MESKTTENERVTEQMEKKDTKTEQGDVQSVNESTDTNEVEISGLIELLEKRWPQPKSITKKHIRDLRVLVVDDQSSMRTIIKNMLIETKFQSSNIDEASDGLRAVEKLKTNHYDLIISDWLMPNLSGIRLLKIVKAVPGFQNTPFLMVTAEGHKDSVIEAIKSGVDNYVIKPFSTEQIAKKLKTVIRKMVLT